MDRSSSVTMVNNDVKTTKYLPYMELVTKRLHRHFDKYFDFKWQQFDNSAHKKFNMNCQVCVV